MKTKVRYMKMFQNLVHALDTSVFKRQNKLNRGSKEYFKDAI